MFIINFYRICSLQLTQRPLLACCSHCVWKIADPSHYHPSFLRKSSWFDCYNREHIAAVSPRLPALFSSLVVGTPAVLRPDRHSSAPRSCKTTPMTGWCHVLRLCLPACLQPLNRALSSTGQKPQRASAVPRAQRRNDAHPPARVRIAAARCRRARHGHGSRRFPRRGEATRRERGNERDANVVSKIIACDARQRSPNLIRAVLLLVSCGKRLAASRVSRSNTH